MFNELISDHVLSSDPGRYITMEHEDACNLDAKFKAIKSL